MKTDREFSRKIVDLAINRGAQEAEVFQRASSMLSAEVKSGEVSAVESAVSAGYGLRVIVKGRPGFFYFTQKNEATRAVEGALETARLAEPDDRQGFPVKLEPQMPDIYDASLESVLESDAINHALSVEQATFAYDKRVKRTRKTMVSISSGETHIVNSKGIDYCYLSSSVSAHIMSVAEEDGESQMGWGFGMARFIDDMDFAAVGSEAGMRAVMMLGAKKTVAIKAPVVIDNHVATEFLSTFSSMLSSENVQKGKSLLAGKLGERVISENVNIVDDGLYPRGTGSRPVDDEGVPTRSKVLIERGVLREFMYNSLTGSREGRASTGNAVRGRFTAVPSVGPLNLYIEPSGKTLHREEMFASINKGLYIIEAMGMHTANPISGEFSIGVSGMLIEGGKLSYPVKEAVISGNVLDFFREVAAVGDDLRFFGNTGSPTLLINATDISA